MLGLNSFVIPVFWLFLQITVDWLMGSEAQPVRKDIQLGASEDSLTRACPGSQGLILCEYLRELGSDDIETPTNAR